ncbi:hypothetical protein THASP1DRAFT_13446 [Thamnocephalis sphaerospora]|uniref:Uncharacterized protein n=1 Tax=Thamnocephalis sphaerospora TaxID=78915 RepID=A0A4P9XUV2_9FUNG|nr:hypothetical protein THASP1DRAFT_13446 [Thamnocephalis sphaerospora]|eukprot:RKP10008.1 hypothetical protein THASP1DRAFT_13446 [Thamnocephalis sphaerospora]
MAGAGAGSQTISAFNAPMMTKEQLEDLRRVQNERVAAEKLRKMGYQPKENMGVRYE